MVTILLFVLRQCLKNVIKKINRMLTSQYVRAKRNPSHSYFQRQFMNCDFSNSNSSVQITFQSFYELHTIVQSTGSMFLLNEGREIREAEHFWIKQKKGGNGEKNK